MTDSELHIDLDIELRNPVVVAAFRGWNDAGDAASFAAQHLGRSWRSKKFAWIDPEEFFDFQSVRPQVKLIDGVTRQISWPSNEFFAARLDGAPHDIMVLVGTEPNLRWRRFAGLVADVAKSHGASLVITLGALLADRHRRRTTRCMRKSGNRFCEPVGGSSSLPCCKPEPESRSCSCGEDRCPCRRAGCHRRARPRNLYL
jgi:proteasome assembly chaperone (PAC2) family protein